MKKYGNPFINEMYRIGDYLFSVMVGQGSVVCVNHVPKKYTFDDKIEWLIEWTEAHGKYINILDSELVDAYAEKFSVKVRIELWGPNGCRDLGRVLSRAYKEHRISRSRISLHGDPGFPKWVYMYNFE